MAQKIEIEVEIDEAGEVSFSVKGVKGKGCLDVTKELEQALGEVKERKHTAEYYEQTKVSQKIGVT